MRNTSKWLTPFLSLAALILLSAQSLRAAPGDPIGPGDRAQGRERPASSTGPFRLPEPPSRDAVRYQADSVEYLRAGPEASSMLLKGRVLVEDSTWTVKAGELRLDLGTRRGYASGGFTIDDGSTAVSGAGGEFDLDTHAGLVLDAYAQYPPWRIWARRAEVDAQRRGRFDDAYFTSCSSSPPHYHFEASRMRVKPGKSISATNAVIYLGRFPLLYTPYLWKSLDPERFLRTRVEPGYDKRNGAFLRTTTLYSPSTSLYGKLFADYYHLQGPGLGNELQFQDTRDARGALSGYFVPEKGGERRWGVAGSHYQTIVSSYSVQARVQAQSDPEFNNHYLRSNAFRVAPDLVNNAALVRQTSLTTTRISYSRQDVTPAPGAEYRKESESLPRVDFQLAPLSWRRLPALWAVSFFADNNYQSSRGFWQKSAGGRIEATQSLTLRRGLTLTPRAAFSDTYADRRILADVVGSTRAVHDTFIGNYELGANLRADTRVGVWDAAYGYSRRLRPGSLAEDAGAVDYGVERNAVELQHTLRPSLRTLSRLKGGYDFRRFRDRTIGFRERMAPIVADLVWLARPGVQVTLRDEYQLERGNQYFLLQADWGYRTGPFQGIGVYHTVQRPTEYLAAYEFGLAPAGGNWRLVGALRAVARSLGGLELAAFRLFEKELRLVKDFHDFHTQLLVRQRPGGVQEAQVRFMLRVGRDEPRPLVRRDWESEWFPWRRTSDAIRD